LYKSISLREIKKNENQEFFMNNEKIYITLQEKIKNFEYAESYKRRCAGKCEKYAIRMHNIIITFLQDNDFEYVCDETKRFIIAKFPISDTTLTVGIFTDEITATTYFLCVFPFENLSEQIVLFDEMEYPYQNPYHEECYDESRYYEEGNSDDIIENALVSFANLHFGCGWSYPYQIGNDCRYVLSDFSRHFYYYKGHGCK